jgi:NTP pyrophosphatase (non-canonical NTP hydrolase)
MKKLQRHNIYRQAIEKWGCESQIDMLVEECAELIVAVNHARRGQWVGQVIHDLINELADVEIMLEQMRQLFDEDEIDRVKVGKVLRLKNRIEGADED